MIEFSSFSKEKEEKNWGIGEMVLTCMPDLSTLSDEVLATQASRSDMESFEELMKRYEKPVLGIAFKITGNKENAEEVLQDTFISIYKNLPNFRNDSSFKTWLYKIATNAALANVRKNKKNTDNISEEIVDDDLSVSPITEWPETPESIYEKKEFSSFIKEAIDKLPEKYKTVFILKDIEEFTNQEIADILGISLPAVKSRLLRARLKVRELLASYGKEALS